MNQKELDAVIKDLEEQTGMKFPEGTCLCEDKSGGLSIIPTKEVNVIEYDKFVSKLNNVTYQGDEYPIGSLRQSCSGNYIKK